MGKQELYFCASHVVQEKVTKVGHMKRGNNEEPPKADKRIKAFKARTWLEHLRRCLPHLRAATERNPVNWQRAVLQDEFITVVAKGLAICARGISSCPALHDRQYCANIQRLGYVSNTATARERWLMNLQCVAINSLRERLPALEPSFFKKRDRGNVDLMSQLPREIVAYVSSFCCNETLRTLALVSKVWNDEVLPLSPCGIAIKFVRRCRKSECKFDSVQFWDLLLECLEATEMVSSEAFTAFAQRFDDSIVRAEDYGDAVVAKNPQADGCVQAYLMAKRVLSIKRGDSTFAVSFNLSRRFGHFHNGRWGFNYGMLDPVSPVRSFIEIRKMVDEEQALEEALGFEHNFPEDFSILPPPDGARPMWTIREVGELLGLSDTELENVIDPDVLNDTEDEIPREVEMVITHLCTPLLQRLAVAAFGEKDAPSFMHLTRAVDDASHALSGLPLQWPLRFKRKAWKLTLDFWNSVFLDKETFEEGYVVFEM